ncbi:c-type cytochrome [Sulfurimonas paralvinellae]|uniref:Cytochrome c1 n=1 Tax=Sulfurimonas paralvinellae TaxID=317658 RepID=A0A7M1B9P5_9BACT|nr:c-type cytochrome [Sulfurimonas paralvinellae]QOP46447.1 cytochrome c1 [Sulfurimonas paralvinellae]
MKELFILVVVTVFTLLTYWLVEPFAHSQMHKHYESEGFAYKDLPALTKKGDAARGKDLVMGAGACTGCHGIKAAGMPAPMDPVTAAQSYGVNPPDLSNAGAVFDPKFLAALIKNPAHALMVEHKFDPAKGQMHPMTQFYGAGGDLDQEVADMVAYLQSIAPKPEELTPNQAFETACGRCHAIHYEYNKEGELHPAWTQIGEKPAFKHKQDELMFEKNVLDYQDALKKYMGTLPPDLSMYIRSRGEHYIKTFVENPQNYLKGTAMPRVGVNAVAAEKVIEHLEDVGDSKRFKREEVGRNVMIFMFIFAIFAILWKKEVWRDLH